MGAPRNDTIPCKQCRTVAMERPPLRQHSCNSATRPTSTEYERQLRKPQRQRGDRCGNAHSVRMQHPQLQVRPASGPGPHPLTAAAARSPLTGAGTVMSLNRSWLNRFPPLTGPKRRAQNFPRSNLPGLSGPSLSRAFVIRPSLTGPLGPSTGCSTAAKLQNRPDGYVLANCDVIEACCTCL